MGTILSSLLVLGNVRILTYGYLLPNLIRFTTLDLVFIPFNVILFTQLK